MSPNTENSNSLPEQDSQIPSGSLLGDILGTQEAPQSSVDLLEESFIPDPINLGDEAVPSAPVPEVPVPPPSVKKPQKKPINTGDFLRIVGAILLVALIFFGAFLAYIVFNPGQASFFINLGINPGDITVWLRQLVRVIFGVATFILAVVWIIFLFKAILTKKEYKKKKTISIIFAVFFGILFFSEITLWAFLEKQINATDYENPDGGVIVYDNEKLLSDRFKNEAKMNNFDNLIGPLTLKFDLKADATLVGKVIDIEKYEIDFDGAKCQGKELSQVTGVNAISDQSIICIFDQAKIFKPKGRYEGTDRVTHKARVMSMNFPAIQIIGTVDIQKPKTYKDKSITYNASRLVNLGKINWLVEKNDRLVSASMNESFSMKMNKDPQVLCLNISPDMVCDKLFIIPQTIDSTITTKIVHEQDRQNSLLYSFKLENTDIKNGEITEYKWVINNTPVSTESTCTFVFSGYGDAKVSLFLTDSAGNVTELTDNFPIFHPLKFVKGGHTESLLKITSAGKTLIEDTYDESLRAYHITNVTTPINIQFDATDVKVENFGYELSKVEWDLDEDGKFEKTGNILKYELVEEKRYTINVRYSFVNKDRENTATLDEKIIFESEKKDISLTMKLSQDSEYAPTTIHVDGSASIPKQGTITKFMYDFGEGKGPIEGDAIQDYRYNFPGEYTITFIVVRDDGTKEQSTRKIVLKDIPKRIVVNTSVSSGIVGKPIDFDTEGTIGQIEAYAWDFGDGTTSSEANVSHTYKEKGKYTVKITVTYADRTVKSTDREIVVNE